MFYSLLQILWVLVFIKNQKKMSSKGINSKVILQANAPWNCSDLFTVYLITWRSYPTFGFILEKKLYVSCHNYLQHLTFDMKQDTKVIIMYQHYLELKSWNLSALKLDAANIIFLEFTVNRHYIIYRDIAHFIRSRSNWTLKALNHRIDMMNRFEHLLTVLQRILCFVL